MITVTIEFEGHILNGEANFVGPHDECDWSKVGSVEPANTDAGFMSRALAAVEDAAYEKYKSNRSRRAYQYDYDYYRNA
tara:strand:- start:592 stop:828 length:237 start_codon:yes stop_codon:yes gene_type:complete